MRDVTVVRNGDELVVRWPAGERPDRVVVSPSPDEPHALDGGVLELGADELVIGLDGHPHRIYAHLFGPDGAHRVVAERLVPLAGTLNFRDLGGYRGLDGRPVRWGRVYRSDGLANLTEGDLDVLGDLGVRVVFDFRSAREHVVAPSRLVDHPAIELVGLPISDGAADEGKDLLEQIVAHELTSLRVEDMAAYYVLTLETQAPRFGQVLTRIADPAEHAIVFHCTAGKDRTGLLAALLLHVLGVPDDVILHDYELTNGYRAERRAVLLAELEPRGIGLDDFRPFFTAVPEVLAGALAHLQSSYGSVEGYLRGPAGLPAATLDALRAALLMGGPLDE